MSIIAWADTDGRHASLYVQPPWESNRTPRESGVTRDSLGRGPRQALVVFRL